MNVFPKNTFANFTTKLPDKIVLDGDYEVALTEILYPASHANFISDHMLVLFKPFDREKGIIRWTIQSGYYADEDAFCRHFNRGVNRAIQKVFQDDELRVTLRYNKSSRRLVYLTTNGELDFNDEAVDRLGFKKLEPSHESINDSESQSHIVSSKESEVVADNEFDLTAGTRLIYVYSDIASYNYVGDIKTPLLRVFNVEGVREYMVTKTFLQPQYLPVSRREFETIEIQISNELGKPMIFRSGKVVVTLHFRRSNKYL
jgi:hypothetical protein